MNVSKVIFFSPSVIFSLFLASLVDYLISQDQGYIQCCVLTSRFKGTAGSRCRWRREGHTTLSPPCHHFPNYGEWTPSINSISFDDEFSWETWPDISPAPALSPGHTPHLSPPITRLSLTGGEVLELFDQTIGDVWQTQSVYVVYYMLTCLNQCQEGENVTMKTLGAALGTRITFIHLYYFMCVSLYIRTYTPSYIHTHTYKHMPILAYTRAHTIVYCMLTYT